MVVKQIEKLGLLSRGQVDRLKSRVKVEFGEDEPGDAVTEAEEPLLLRRMAELHYGQGFNPEGIARENALPADIVGAVLGIDPVTQRVRNLFERSLMGDPDGSRDA